MPIDDALKNLEPAVKNTPVVKNSKKGANNFEVYPDELIDDATKKMGKILIAFFQNELKDQTFHKKRTKTYELPDELVPFVQNLGIYMFNITPFELGRLVTTFNKDINLNYHDFISKIYGKYILETDLSEIFKDSKLENLIKNIPEFRLIQSELINVGMDAQKEHAVINPYIITMGIKPQYRAFACMAVYDLFGDDNNIEITGTQDIFLASPGIKNYVNVAEKYKIKLIATVMENFNKVCDLYIKKWRLFKCQ